MFAAVAAPQSRQYNRAETTSAAATRVTPSHSHELRTIVSGLPTNGTWATTIPTAVSFGTVHSSEESLASPRVSTVTLPD